MLLAFWSLTARALLAVLTSLRYKRPTSVLGFATEPCLVKSRCPVNCKLANDTVPVNTGELRVLFSSISVIV